MPLSDALLILGGMLALGALSAFFSGMETALFSLQPRQIARLREQLPQRAQILDALTTQPRRILSLILLADTLTNLPLCLLCLFVLHAEGAWRLYGAAGFLAGGSLVTFWPAALLLFGLIVGVCDLLPKLFALRHAERVSRPALAALHFLRPLLDPACGALQAAGERLADLLTPASMQTPLQLSAPEFEALVAVGAEEGALHGLESEMIQEVIKLGDKTAKDCMTPRVEIFAITDDLSNEKAAERLRAERRRRVPVYADTPDDIVGVLDSAKFLLRFSEAAPDCPHYTEVMDPPSYVSETMGALNLLRSFLSHPQGLAVLVDEYGGTEGIVTMADIVEELVEDVLPSGEEALYIDELDEDRLLVGGHARLDDISEHPGFALEAEGLDTISGLIFNHLGYLPHAGTVLSLPPLKLTVRRVTRKRITEVLVEREPPPEPGTDVAAGHSPALP